MSGQELIRIGLVGCGGMARSHARNFRTLPQVRVEALCDIDLAAANRLGDEFFPAAADQPGPPPRPTLYDRFDKMLAGAKLDAVVLVTPHAVHFPHTMAALDAGLHVLVEKPMVTDSRQARAVRDKVAASGKVLQIAFQGAYTAEHAYARKVIAGGQLGELRTIDGHVFQGWQENTRGKWRQDPAVAGGGFLYDSGAHLFNGIMWLADSPAVEVYAVVDNRSAPVDVDGSVSIRFANGCIGSAACCGSAPRPSWSSGITVTGTLGMLRLPTHTGKLEHVGPDGKVIDYPAVSGPNLTPQESFVRVILGQGQPVCGVEYGVLLADLMDAIYESVRTGQPARPRAGD